MKARKYFDTRLKYDAIRGFVPDEFKKLVTPRFIDDWKRNLNPDNLIGFNYYNKKEFEGKKLQDEIHKLNQKIEALSAENELFSALTKAATDNYEIYQLIKNQKADILNLIDQKSKVIGIKKCAKIFNVTPPTIHKWRKKELGDCKYSNKLTCVKGRINRLTKDEELKIIQLLQDTRYEHYPLTSLMWKAHYEGIVHAGAKTWRKIQKDNDLQRKRIKKYRYKRKKPLRAEYPNQFLHADITHFKLTNNKTYYIYIVKDNFSKYIKSWYISDKIRGETRVKTFEDALKDINYP